MMVIVTTSLWSRGKHGVSVDELWPPARASLAFTGWDPLEEGLCGHSLDAVLSSLP